MVKLYGSYHGFRVEGELDEETSSVKFVTFLGTDGRAMPKNAGLAGKTYPNRKQAGRAAFDAITDYEKLPRLPDTRWMTMREAAPKAVSEPKAEKASNRKVENDATATRTRRSRRAGAVTSTKSARGEGKAESKPANKSKRSSKSAPAGEPEELDL